MRNIFTLLLTLGWRNLWRNKRRTLIMLAALSIGVWAMIWMTALMRGMAEQMVESAIESLSGDLQIHAPGFRDDPSINNSMHTPDSKLLAALDDPAILKWSMRLRIPAMISSERHDLPVTLVGIDPQQEQGLSFIMHADIEGVMLRDRDDRGLLVGKRLLDKLETRAGKRVVIMSQDRNNQIVDRGFRITGVYSTTTPGMEQQFVFAGLHTIQKMLHCDQCISEISIKAQNHLQLEPLIKRLAIASQPNEVLTWMELDPYAKAMLASVDGYILMFIVIIFITLSFGLANTLVMAIFERSREIALVHALGLAPRYIALQILLEAGLLIVIGLLIGNALAFASLLPIRDGINLGIVAQGLEMFGMGSVLKPAIQTHDLLAANLTAIVFGLLSCGLPAWRAAQKAPAAALNRGET